MLPFGVWSCSNTKALEYTRPLMKRKQLGCLRMGSRGAAAYQEPEKTRLPLLNHKASHIS